MCQKCDLTLLTEISLSNLKQKTNASFGPDRNKRSKRVQIQDIVYIPSLSEGILQVVTHTTTDGKTIYKTVVVFDNVHISIDREDDSMIRFKSSSGFYFYFKPVDKNADVKVTCTCLDFYYRFAVWDDKSKALYGKAPPPYIKTTNRPYVNPFKTPGVCKHIMAVMDRLKNRKFFI